MAILIDQEGLDAEKRTHVIGTAGHVDHGKSTLVQALTGIDPDRLAEEKAREMTIDLGFAWLELGDEEVGIVDVPGHRDFIENMLAGVGGIDIALFVIAADEGVMPQTREHLAILDLLDVSTGIVALTKIDLVDDPEWLSLVQQEVRETLDGTSLQQAPIVALSARTGQGIDELRLQILSLLASQAGRKDIGRPRLPIDRVFTISGFGTIVTGTLLDGSFKVGDEVEIQPGDLSTRIRGLQTHKTKREAVYPGSRVAINLTGVGRTQLHRGQVVSLPGLLHETLLIDAAYNHLSDASQPLAHNDQVKLFSGSAEVNGRVRLIGQDMISPGQNGWLQIALADPVAVITGDRYILRRPSPGATIGGGMILDPFPGRKHRRFHPEIIERFEVLSTGSPEDQLVQLMHRRGVMTAAEIQSSMSPGGTDWQTIVDHLISEGRVVNTGNNFIAASTWDKQQGKSLHILNLFHQQYPLRYGIGREELRSRLRLNTEFFVSLIADMVSSGQIYEQGVYLSRTDHSVQFSKEQERDVESLWQLLEESGVSSPSVKISKSIVGDEVYRALIESGQVMQVSPEVVYRKRDYERIIDQITTFLQENGRINAAQTRDLIGASRKYAIALLEHLDDRQITRRDGDLRVLRNENST